MTLRTVCTRAVRTRRGVAGMLVGVAAVGLGISAGFGGSPARAGSAPGAGAAVSAAGAVSVAAAARLDRIALRVARENGDASPAWITAVRTTHGRALTSATPGDTEPAGTDAVVYLVTMQGHFVARLASVPPGAKAPTGSYLSIVINAGTFAAMDVGLSPRFPAVAPASLGPVRSLKV